MGNAQSIYALRNEVKILKQRIGELTREHSEMESGFEHLILIQRRKVENLENLVGVLNTRLARMADRLTALAAERNMLYSRYQRSDHYD